MSEGTTGVNPQTGERWIVRGGQWVPDTGDSPAPRPAGPILGPRKAPPAPPSTYDQQQDAIDYGFKARDEQRDITKIDTDASKAQFDQASQFRGEYNKLPSVLNYTQALPVYASGLQTQPTPQGDLSLTYAYAKIMDPGSVVRESEQTSIANSQAVIERLPQDIKRQFLSDGSFTPENRRRLRGEMKTRIGSYNDAYIGDRVRYKDMSVRYGLNPLDVVGEHIGGRYQDVSRDYWNMPVKQLDWAGNPTGAPDPEFDYEGQGGEPRPDGVQRSSMMPVVSEVPEAERRLTTEDGFEYYTTEQDVKNKAELNAALWTPGMTVGRLRAIAERGGYADNINWGAAPEILAGVKRGSYAPGSNLAGPDFNTGRRFKEGTWQANVANTGPGAALVGAYDAATMGFGDEMAAGLGAVTSSLSGEGGSVGDNYNRKIEQNRGAMGVTQEQSPYWYMGGQVAGSLAPGVALERLAVKGLGKAGVAVPETMMARGAVGGGSYGAAYGAGTAEGGVGSRLAGGGIGALTGAGGGALIGKGIDKLSPHAGRAVAALRDRRVSNDPVDNVDNAVALIDAGRRQNIPVRQPDARPSVRNDFAAAETSPGGGPIISKTRAADRDLFESRVAELAPTGRAINDDVMGGMVRGVTSRHKKSTSRQAEKLYEKVEKLAPGHRAPADKAINLADEMIANLKANGSRGNAATIKVIRDVRDDLADTGVSVQSLQSLRANTRSRANVDGVDRTAVQKMIGDIVKEASDDLDASLATNPSARSALGKANQHWATRSEFRKKIASAFQGKASDGSVGRRFRNAIGNSGDYARFKAMQAQMTPDEMADYGASIAYDMGRGTNGVFTYGQFVRDVVKLDKRAVLDIFGPKGAAAIDDLKLLASAKSETTRELTNYRAAAAQNNSVVTTKNVIGAGVGGTIGGLPAAIGGAWLTNVITKVLDRRAANVLLDPNFTKWLRAAQKAQTPKSYEATIKRLNVVATRSPAIAGDIRSLQQALSDAFSQPPRLAAEEETQ